MALIKCPECGREVSDKSKQCIHCGYPIIKTESQQELNKDTGGGYSNVSNSEQNLKHIMKDKKKLFLIILMIILIIGLFGVVKVSTSKQVDGKENDKKSSYIDVLVAQSKGNIQPYLSVLGADITNGNPEVSQEFIDNLNSVEIMEYSGSVEHGYNTYNDKTYIELMTWKTNNFVTEKEFDDFIKLMNVYFEQDAILVSYDSIDDEVWGWLDSSKQYSIITYYKDEKFYLQWDVKLDFEEEETLNVDNSITKTEVQENVCIECGEKAFYTYTNPFSMQEEHYCNTHYKAMIDMMSDMEEDVGSSDYSKHTCEECGKEGTHKYESFTGQTEYYCTTHYKELMDMLDTLGVD